MLRAYGLDETTRFGFETQVAARQRILLVVAPKRLLPDGIGEVSVMLDGKDAIRLHYGTFVLSDGSSRLVKLFPDDDAVRRISEASTIAIGDWIAPIRGHGVQAALRALDTCTGDLLASWGVDPGLYLQDRIARLMGNPDRWLNRDSYPRDAGGAAGAVVLLMKTAPDGSISECRAVVAENARLGTGTCSIVVRHVTTRPPVDADGRPIASYAVLMVRWTKP